MAETEVTNGGLKDELMCSQNIDETEGESRQNSYVPVRDIEKIPVAGLLFSCSSYPNYIVCFSPSPSRISTVEVCLKKTSTSVKIDIINAVHNMLAKRCMSYMEGLISLGEIDDPFLKSNVERITVYIDDRSSVGGQVLLFWQASVQIFVYQLSEEGPGEEFEENGQLTTFQEWDLPARDFHGLWESLILNSGIKQRLLRYSSSALLFADHKVDPQLISWNRVVLLFGPPGTGKTSLCKGLAQKLSIRHQQRYDRSLLVEVNAHSLFSKWFSESGKLVSQLFQKINELLEEEHTLVFVLIDEVESLTSARQAALQGSEPSDSIRVVNALLTQLDALKRKPNVMVLTTSNITQAIDIAFVDRADIKAYIGPPAIEARYEILLSCIAELMQKGIILGNPSSETQGDEIPAAYSTLMMHSNGRGYLSGNSSSETLQLASHLYNAARACEGLSGRALRKLPFLAHTIGSGSQPISTRGFMNNLMEAIHMELSDRCDMEKNQQQTKPNTES